MLKPLKINDEITIIPQPARAKTKPAGPNRNPQKKVLQIFLIFFDRVNLY